MGEPTPEEVEKWNLSQIRQQRSRLRAKPISSVMRTLMARSGYGQTKSNERLAESFRIAAGEPLASYARPGNINRGVLQVHVANSTVLQEFHFSKRQILKKLQAEIPEANIKDLRAKITKLD